MKTDSNEEGGSDGMLLFSEKERGNVWKDYTEGIVNEENEWDHNMEGDEVEKGVVCVGREEVVQALVKMKTGKAPGLSSQLIAASREVGLN